MLGTADSPQEIVAHDHQLSALGDRFRDSRSHETVQRRVGAAERNRLLIEVALSDYVGFVMTLILAEVMPLV